MAYRNTGSSRGNGGGKGRAYGEQDKPSYGERSGRSYHREDNRQGTGGYRKDSQLKSSSQRSGYQKNSQVEGNYRNAGREAGGYRSGNSRTTYRGEDSKPSTKFEAKPLETPSAPFVESVPTLADELPYLVMGRNAVKEALRSGRSIDRILVTKEQDGSLRELVNMAKDRRVPLREVDRAKLDEMCMPFGHGNRSGNHQGIVAQVPGVEYCELEDILSLAEERKEPPFVILLDGIEDPHNLGSILRSAECAGAHGVILPKRRSTGVTAAACKASAGAVEYIKVARVSNLATAMERLKSQGLWLAGADMEGTPMTAANLKGPLGLVIGGEGKGLGKLIRDRCDFLVSIPMAGKLDSLNAAVAAAILMFEKKRQG